MNKIRTAVELIQQTEEGLRGLISEAVQDAAFVEAKTLVDAAAALAALREQLMGNRGLGGGTLRASEPADSREKTSLNPDIGQAGESLRAQRSSVSRKPVADEFPRFERDGNRLVKIGWSAKDKHTYEHRVTRETVMAVGEYVAQKTRPKRLFKMEKLLPFTAPDGTEIPSYKAYLVIKWLQGYDAIHRKGKDGYVLGDEAIDASNLNKLWNQTPARDEVRRRDVPQAGVSE